MLTLIVLDQQSIFKDLNLSEVIDAVRDGMVRYSNGHFNIPDRMHLHAKKGVHLIMPAFEAEYYCTKLVNVYPENSNRGIPTTLGSLILGSAETGEVLAVMDAATVTALRTGAVGALGISLISNKLELNLGIVGTGVQAIWQVVFSSLVAKIKTVYFTSRSKSKFEYFKTKIEEFCPDLTVKWQNKVCDVIENVDAVIACTTTNSPLIEERYESNGNVDFSSVGSFRKDMQEWPNSVYRNVDYVIVDSPFAKGEVGDLINPIRNGELKEEQIIFIGDILSGKITIDPEKKMAFKSVGMAAYDLVTAIMLYQKRIK